MITLITCCFCWRYNILKLKYKYFARPNSITSNNFFHYMFYFLSSETNWIFLAVGPLVDWLMRRLVWMDERKRFGSLVWAAGSGRPSHLQVPRHLLPPSPLHHYHSLSSYRLLPLLLLRAAVASSALLPSTSLFSLSNPTR